METDNVKSTTPNLSENAVAVLRKRYLKKNEAGEPVEEPIDLFRRVAATIAGAELRFKGDGRNGKLAEKFRQEYEGRFLELMLSGKFMPNSPTLMNAGRELAQLSACFVLPVEDSIDSIYDTLKHQAIIHKSGGGTGFAFSRLRPKNDIVKSTMGVSSGPVSFMAVFDASTEHIKQGGTRRGANMGILRCLSGDTMLDTVDGPRRIADLVGQRPYLFARDPRDGYINAVRAARVFVSDKDREMVRVSFEGGHLDCTPDHRVMLADGSYKEAGRLEPSEQLIALDEGIRALPHAALHARTIAETSSVPKPRPLTREEVERIPSGVFLSEPNPEPIVSGRLKPADRLRASRLLDLGPDEMGLKGSASRRVLSVEELPDHAPEVYDVSMPAPHNFAASGVFVHNCDHPDIEEFIECKRDNDKVNNFNISVAITDEFMEAVDGDTDFDLVNPRDGKVAQTIRARDLFEKIVEGAHLNGEPGVVFIDRINDDNPTPQFEIESTNPCSEAHLPPYDSCNLGSINLERFVGEDEPVQTNVHWDSLADAVRVAVRFLDNVIEVNGYPLPHIEEMSKGNRRIGLGVMGFADALIKLGIPYDSEEGLAFAEDVMKFVDDEAWEASRALAEERGVMPHFEGSRHEVRGDRVRNATVTTIAPTGTISIIAGCSGGIEPLFALAFMRRQADMELPDVNPRFVSVAKARGFYSEDLMKRVAEHGSVRDTEEFPDVPDDARRTFVTAQDISPEFHVRMQASFQKHTSMGISKTINLPHEATVRDVEDAYVQAYETGCKGIAVYRDGSRDAQVLSTGKTGMETTGGSDATQKPGPAPTLAEARNGRPATLSGATKKVKTGHGPMYVSMNDDEFGPRECFVILGKPGGTAAAFSDALGRMISLALTHGAAPEEIVNQLRGIQDGHPAGLGGGAVLSVPDGVAKAMAEHYLSHKPESPQEPSLPIVGACPECSGALAHEEGCQKCHACGYSRC